jgi:hypothetical protein
LSIIIASPSGAVNDFSDIYDKNYMLFMLHLPVRVLCLDNATNRANFHALRRGGMALALDTGGSINHVNDTITFADGTGGAFRHTYAASNTIV